MNVPDPLITSWEHRWSTSDAFVAAMPILFNLQVKIVEGVTFASDRLSCHTLQIGMELKTPRREDNLSLFSG